MKHRLTKNLEPNFLRTVSVVQLPLMKWHVQLCGRREQQRGGKDREGKGKRNKEQGTRNKEQGTRNKEQGKRKKIRLQDLPGNYCCLEGN